MKTKAVWCALAWLVAAQGNLLAQAQRPARAASASGVVGAVSSGPAASESARADMARAQRAAANPLKAIIEASRIRRRSDGEAAPDLASPTTRRAAAPAVRTATNDGTGPAPEAESSAAASADGGIRVIGTLPADLPGVPAPAVDAARPAASLAAGEPLRLPAPAATTALPFPALLAPVPPPPPASGPGAEEQPRLVYVVEPDVPERLLDPGVRHAVTVDLSLRADGTVAEVLLLPPASPQLRPFLAQALLQWRFEPLGGPRTHRVQLVLNPAR